MIQGAKYLWQLPAHDNAAVCALAARFSLSIPVAQVLIQRGINTLEGAELFLFGAPEQVVADASLLKDAEKAIVRIIQAIEKQEKILIAGDYDVDGVTSSALMMICLAPLGANVNFFLPNRLRDGYGLSVKTVQKAAKSNYSVIITVDNGITAFEPAQEAKKLGIDLIITDHHRPHEHLPEAYAVVDPHQKDCPYPYKKFAGVGISFKLMALLYKRLGKELPEKVYELLLLGTVADVVPLTGENRYWVRYGLRTINTFESYSLHVLKQNGKVTRPAITSLDIGFSIAPQINALGRLEDAREAVKFLVGSDYSETERIGKVLLRLNEARKAIEQSVLADIKALIAAGDIDVVQDYVLIAAHSNWPTGVIGLVASRLVGMYGRPAILLHKTGDGLVKGSCRSIPEFNMFEALQECHDILITFGGHPMAAGLSLKESDLPELKKRLCAHAARVLTPADLQHKLRIDAQLTLPDMTKKIMADLAHLEPFGCENAQPVFWVKGVSLLEDPVLLKGAHLKCMVFADGVIKPVIFFNRPELYDLLCAHGREAFDIAVYVTENHWSDRVSIELQGIDIALPCSPACPEPIEGSREIE